MLTAAGVRRGTRLLDVGCGSGVACRIATYMGAIVAGVDVTPGFIDLARQRAPGGSFRVGGIDDIPAEDESFDVVTSFASIMFAADPATGAGELRRVTRPGGTVAVVVPVAEGSDWWPVIGAVLAELPDMPSEGANTLELSNGDSLRRLLADAGLHPAEAITSHTVWSYPDAETAMRAMMSSGPMAGAVSVIGNDRVREVGAAALAPFGSEDGLYHLDAYFTMVLATR